MIIKLTKLTDNPNEDVDGHGFKAGKLGFMPAFPEVGKEFYLYHNSEHDASYLRTTPVKSFEKQSDGSILMETHNTKYRIEIQ